MTAAVEERRNSGLVCGLILAAAAAAILPKGLVVWRFVQTPKQSLPALLLVFGTSNVLQVSALYGMRVYWGIRMYGMLYAEEERWTPGRASGIVSKILAAGVWLWLIQFVCLAGKLVVITVAQGSITSSLGMMPEVGLGSIGSMGAENLYTMVHSDVAGWILVLVSQWVAALCEGVILFAAPVIGGRCGKNRAVISAVLGGALIFWREGLGSALSSEAEDLPVGRAVMPEILVSIVLIVALAAAARFLLFKRQNASRAAE